MSGYVTGEIVDLRRIPWVCSHITPSGGIHTSQAAAGTDPDGGNVVLEATADRRVGVHVNGRLLGHRHGDSGWLQA